MRNTESVLTRLHFVVRVAPGTALADADADAIEAKLAAATRTWDDDFADALLGDFGEAQARELREAYGAALPEAYKAEERPEMAVADVKVLEGLKASGEGSAVRLYEEVDSAPGDRRFRIYRVGSSVSLAEVLPVFQRMGVEVVDEFPYDLEIDTPNQPDSRIYDFGLRCDPASIAEYGMDEAARTRFQEAFTAIWTGRAENDRFNTLVPLAGLTWRQVVILRAYVKYLRQGGMTSSQELVESVVANNRRVARLLVKLFEAKFSPAYSHETPELWESIVEEIDAALDNVQSLDEDRILRSLLKVIQATLRTNYFQTGPDGEPKPYVSFKLDPHAVPDLPAPLPKFEIWVYSPQVEGVHLRFGKVARGGLRWSDRREDFRTEILGLVKAQMVKNAVIVPVGSKGGFYAKNLPDPSVDRDAWLAEGVSSYKTFISGLLDITDNLVSGEVVPAGRRGAPRRRRPLSGGRRRQGHRDVLRHRQRPGHRLRVLARRRLRLRRLGGLRPQGHGHHRPRRLGGGQAPLPRAGHGHPDRGVHRGRRRRHVRRRVRQRHAAVRAHPAGRGLRPPPHLPGPRPRRGGVLRRAAADVRPAALVVGRLRHRPDQRRRRGVPAQREVDPDHPAGAPGARAGVLGAAAGAERTAQRDPEGAGRPVLERRHRHLRQGLLAEPRRGRRQGQRRDPDQRPGVAGARRGRGRQPGLHPARPDRVRGLRRPGQRAAGSTPTPSTTPRAWTPPTTR